MPNLFLIWADHYENLCKRVLKNNIDIYLPDYYGIFLRIKCLLHPRLGYLISLRFRINY